MVNPTAYPELTLLVPSNWKDYELLDSGAGLKLERFGPYRFIRPEHQAIWKPALAKNHWDQADAVFQPTGEESGGHWKFNRSIEKSWTMSYQSLRFQVQAAPSRHLGIFPEQATQWDWLALQIKILTETGKSIKFVWLYRPGLPGSGAGWGASDPYRCFEKNGGMGAQKSGALKIESTARFAGWWMTSINLSAEKRGVERGMKA